MIRSSVLTSPPDPPGVTICTTILLPAALPDSHWTSKHLQQSGLSWAWLVETLIAKPYERSSATGCGW